MRRIRKIGVVLYLIAAVVVVGLFAGSQFGPHADRFDALLAVPWVRVLAFACVCVVLIQMAVLLIAAIADKPEPEFLRLAGDMPCWLCRGYAFSRLRACAWCSSRWRFF